MKKSPWRGWSGVETRSRYHGPILDHDRQRVSNASRSRHLRPAETPYEGPVVRRTDFFTTSEARAASVSQGGRVPPPWAGGGWVRGEVRRGASRFAKTCAPLRPSPGSPAAGRGAPGFPARLKAPRFYTRCRRARIFPTCSSAPGPATSRRMASAQGQRTIASRRWSPSAQRGSERSSQPAIWEPCSP